MDEKLPSKNNSLCVSPILTANGQTALLLNTETNMHLSMSNLLVRKWKTNFVLKQSRYIVILKAYY